VRMAGTTKGNERNTIYMRNNFMVCLTSTYTNRWMVLMKIRILHTHYENVAYTATYNYDVSCP
jgi:hypothetical protein